MESPQNDFFWPLNPQLLILTQQKVINKIKRKKKICFSLTSDYPDFFGPLKKKLKELSNIIVCATVWCESNLFAQSLALKTQLMSVKLNTILSISVEKLDKKSQNIEGTSFMNSAFQ